MSRHRMARNWKLSSGFIATISRIIDKYFKYVTLISYYNSFYNQWMLPLI
jgi:hypothetical protein